MICAKITELLSISLPLCVYVFGWVWGGGGGEEEEVWGGNTIVVQESVLYGFLLWDITGRARACCSCNRVE